MSAPFLGQLLLVPYNFAPRGWAFCDGQILPISQNTALFSLLGTTYGGNGQVTFALPDLRGRVAISSGQGPGLSNYDIGQVGGVESVTLTQSELPAHSHALNASSGDSDQSNPVGTTLLGHPTVSSGEASSIYTTSPPDTTMSPSAIGPSGQNFPHQNLPPYLTLNYVIALQGIFPSRN